MQRFRVDLKTFWACLCLTNAAMLSESKYQAGFGVIISGQNPQTFTIPIYSTTVLYDSTTILYDIQYSLCEKAKLFYDAIGGLVLPIQLTKKYESSPVHLTSPVIAALHP